MLRRPDPFFKRVFLVARIKETDEPRRIERGLRLAIIGLDGWCRPPPAGVVRLPDLWRVLPSDWRDGGFMHPKELARFDRPLDRTKIIQQCRMHQVGRHCLSPITD